MSQRTMTIEGPGGRTATLTIPDGATEEQIMAKAESVKQQLMERASAEENNPAGDQEQIQEQQDGALVEAARAAEDFLYGAFDNKEERLQLIENMSNVPDVDDGTTTIEERMMARQQAMWDEIPAPQKFLIGMGSAVDNLKDWGMGAILGDTEVRNAEDAVFDAIDEQNAGAEDAGQLLGEIALLYTGGRSVQQVGKIVGGALAFGRGGIRMTRDLVKAVQRYNPKTIDTFMKSKDAKNLAKAAKKGGKASEVAAQGAVKKMDRLDEIITKSQAAGGRLEKLNPKVAQKSRLNTVQKQREAAKKIQAEFNKAQKRGEQIKERQMKQKHSLEKTLGMRGETKRFNQRKNKEAARNAPGGY